MKPTKKCSVCKAAKNVNHFSSGEWKRLRGGRICCKCVKAKQPTKSGGGKKAWSDSMGRYFVTPRSITPDYN